MSLVYLPTYASPTDICFTEVGDGGRHEQEGEREKGKGSLPFEGFEENLRDSRLKLSYITTIKPEMKLGVDKSWNSTISNLVKKYRTLHGI